MVTYADVRSNNAIREYIKRADESLAALGFTEHSFAHVTRVAVTASYILEQLGFDEHDIEIVKIAGPDGLEEIVKVNEGMKQIVKDSNGDPDTFRSLYKQRVQESSPRIGAEIEKAGGLYNYLSKTTK